MASSSSGGTTCSEVGGGGSERKRRRMESNRESARRSRMRKQNHLDDLVAEVGRLREDKSQIMGSVEVMSQRFVSVEAENQILRAQVGELRQRLESLNEILNFVGAFDPTDCVHATDGFTNPLNLPYLNLSIMASADMFQYY